jgi:hypothetical protein
MANHLAQSGITLSCAIYAGQYGGCSGNGCGILFVAADCCRGGWFTSHGFRAKSLSHPYSQRFADA